MCGALRYPGLFFRDYRILLDVSLTLHDSIKAVTSHRAPTHVPEGMATHVVQRKALSRTVTADEQSTSFYLY
jgi:hypothetical protein